MKRERKKFGEADSSGSSTDATYSTEALSSVNSTPQRVEPPTRHVKRKLNLDPLSTRKSSLKPVCPTAVAPSPAVTTPPGCLVISPVYPCSSETGVVTRVGPSLFCALPDMSVLMDKYVIYKFLQRIRSRAAKCIKRGGIPPDAPLFVDKQMRMEITVKGVGKMMYWKTWLKLCGTEEIAIYTILLRQYGDCTPKSAKACMNLGIFKVSRCGFTDSLISLMRSKFGIQVDKRDKFTFACVANLNGLLSWYITLLHRLDLITLPPLTEPLRICIFLDANAKAGRCKVNGEFFHFLDVEDCGSIHSYLPFLIQMRTDARKAHQEMLQATAGRWASPQPQRLTTAGLTALTDAYHIGLKTLRISTINVEGVGTFKVMLGACGDFKAFVSLFTLESLKCSNVAFPSTPTQIPKGLDAEWFANSSCPCMCSNFDVFSSNTDMPYIVHVDPPESLFRGVDPRLMMYGMLHAIQSIFGICRDILVIVRVMCRGAANKVEEAFDSYDFGPGWDWRAGCHATNFLPLDPQSVTLAQKEWQAKNQTKPKTSVDKPPTVKERQPALKEAQRQAIVAAVKAARRKLQAAEKNKSSSDDDSSDADPESEDSVDSNEARVKKILAKARKTAAAAKKAAKKAAATVRRATRATDKQSAYKKPLEQGQGMGLVFRPEYDRILHFFGVGWDLKDQSKAHWYTAYWALASFEKFHPNSPIVGASTALAFLKRFVHEVRSTTPSSATVKLCGHNVWKFWIRMLSRAFPCNPAAFAQSVRDAGKVPPFDKRAFAIGVAAHCALVHTWEWIEAWGARFFPRAIETGGEHVLYAIACLLLSLQLRQMNHDIRAGTLLFHAIFFVVGKALKASLAKILARSIMDVSLTKVAQDIYSIAAELLAKVGEDAPMGSSIADNDERVARVLEAARHKLNVDNAQASAKAAGIAARTINDAINRSQAIVDAGTHRRRKPAGLGKDLGPHRVRSRQIPDKELTKAYWEHDGRPPLIARSHRARMDMLRAFNQRNVTTLTYPVHDFPRTTEYTYVLTSFRALQTADTALRLPELLHAPVVAPVVNVPSTGSSANSRQAVAVSVPDSSANSQAVAFSVPDNVTEASGGVEVDRGSSSSSSSSSTASSDSDSSSSSSSSSESSD